jgi:hypothetical protein
LNTVKRAANFSVLEKRCDGADAPTYTAHQK